MSYEARLGMSWWQDDVNQNKRRCCNVRNSNFFIGRNSGIWKGKWNKIHWKISMAWAFYLVWTPRWSEIHMSVLFRVYFGEEKNHFLLEKYIFRGKLQKLKWIMLYISVLSYWNFFFVQHIVITSLIYTINIIMLNNWL